MIEHQYGHDFYDYIDAGGGQHIKAAHQQDLALAIVSAALKADKAGLHTALGGAERGQAGLARFEQDEILRQLALQEACGISAFDLDDAQGANWHDTVQAIKGGYIMSHRLNYHQ